MGVLLHYLKTQVNLDHYNLETLVRTINARISLDFNEQLQRQYDDLNAVEKLWSITAKCSEEV